MALKTIVHCAHRSPGLWLLLCLANLIACQAQPVSKPLDTPAVLVQTNAITREELRTAVMHMLRVPSVTIADDALTHDSLIIIEKVRPRDAKGLPLSGRDFDKPEQFRLIKNQDQCVLIQLRTGLRETLKKSQCLAVEK